MKEKSDTFWGKFKYNSSDFAAEACERFRSHQELYDRAGQLNRIWRAWSMYYSRNRDGNYDDSELERFGKKGEFVKARIAEFRSLVRNTLTLATQSPLSFVGLAVEDGSRGVEAAYLAKPLLQHYTKAGGLDAARYDWGEAVLVTTAAWATPHWNKALGQATFDDQGKVMFAGDVQYRIANVLDVAYELDSADVRHPDWLVTQVWMNRYLLAQRYSKHKRAILNMSSDDVADAGQARRLRMTLGERKREDFVRVLEVWFPPSELVPMGRRALVLSDKIVLDDGPNPYSRIPYVALFQSRVIGDGVGYADSHDLLNLCELIQDAISANASVQANQRQVVYGGPKEEGIHYSAVGPFAMVYGPVAPQSLPVFQLTADSIAWPKELRETAQMYSNISDTMRGQTNASDSGAKLAFEVSTAQQFNQGGFARQLTVAVEELATLTLEVLSVHVDVERAVAIAGETNRSRVVRFKGEQLRPLVAAQITSGDPALDTAGGRQHIADLLLEKGLIKTPSQYVTAIRTGDVDVIHGPYIDHQARIQRENEQLKNPNAPPPVVCVADNHKDHWIAHSVQLLDDAVLNDPAIKARHEAHMLEHAQYATPGMEGYHEPAMVFTGQQGLPPPAQQLNPGGASGGGAPGLNAGAMPNPPGPKGGEGSVGQPNIPAMPSMPKGAGEMINPMPVPNGATPVASGDSNAR